MNNIQKNIMSALLFTLTACSTHTSLKNDNSDIKLSTVKSMYNHAVEKENLFDTPYELQAIYDYADKNLQDLIVKIKQGDYETNECTYAGINSIKLLDGNGIGLAEMNIFDYKITPDNLVQVDMTLLDTGVNIVSGESLTSRTKVAVTCHNNECKVSDIIFDNTSMVSEIGSICK